MRAVFSRILYGLILFGSLILAWAGHSLLGYPIYYVTAVMLVGAGLLVWAIEYLMPYTEKWKPPASQMGLDFAHSMLSSFGVALLMRTTVLTGLAYFGTQLTASLGWSLWPSHLPVALQLVITLLIADLGAYTAHRIMHLTNWGWRIHALHHSPVKMHFMAAGRTHPFNAVFTMLLENGPILFMGISPEALLLFSVYKGVNGFLQHSNIDLKPGFLSYIIATNDAHWWHHSKVRGESETNFGNTTMIWDQVFGSFYMPSAVRPRQEVGIDNAAIPEHFFVQLTTPFTLQNYETDVEPPTAAAPEVVRPELATGS